MYDTIIIGGGPAGLSAAIYASRRGMKTMLITRDLGGQTTKTVAIENYPGFDKISGLDLANKLYRQAKSFGTEFVFDEATKIESEKGTFRVISARKTLEAKSLIVTSGKKPRELGVAGEEKFKGRGVSYCATCDSLFFKDRTVIIVGGGNSALEAILLTAPIAQKVYVTVREADFIGEKILIDRAKALSNVEIMLNVEIAQIRGDKKVESVLLSDKREIVCDGLLVEIGYTIDRSLIEGLLDMDAQGQVVINDRQETSQPGIFAAGDLTTTPFKQIVISAGEGAKAALAAYDYLQKQIGKKGVKGDWH